MDKLYYRHRAAATLAIIENEILAERFAQDQKWGEQNHDDLYWLGIFMEEVGEVAKEAIEYRPGQALRLRKELIQAVAVAVAWLECADRRKRE